MAEIKFNCENCRYWQNHQIIGICRRYPQFQNKARTDWCGEFAAERMIALPVVEMPKEKRKYTRGQNVEASA